jgi:hypothetical protein
MNQPSSREGERSRIKQAIRWECTAQLSNWLLRTDPAEAARQHVSTETIYTAHCMAMAQLVKCAAVDRYPEVAARATQQVDEFLQRTS